MTPGGIEFARARRPVLKQLIQEDPRRALEEAVPIVLRQELPDAVVEFLEERVNGRAALRVYQGVGLDNRSPVATFRIAEFPSGRNYEAHVYGRRAHDVRWLAGASLNGVAIDQHFAVGENPFRRLEIGERPSLSQPAVAICPVSGKSSLPEEKRGEPISEETPAVEAFGEIAYLCDGAHAAVYQEQLIYAEGGTGGPIPFTGILPAAPTPSIGNVKVLVIPMTFADQNDTPATESALYQLMRDVGNHYARASYGKLTLLSTVSPAVKLPHNEAWYIQKDTSNGGTIDGLGLEHSHARAEARMMGFEDDEYDCVVVRLRGGPRAAGGYGGGRNVWIYSDGVDVTTHEIGHVFGLAHANFWNTGGTSAIGVGANEEYGGHWDVMGGTGLPNGHYNAAAKNQIRWLPDPFVTEVNASGVYRIYAQDQSILDPAKRFALKIRKDTVRTYWGELRGLYTGHATRTWADYGLILGWKYPGAGGSNIQLIDTTPGSAFGKDDSPISLGRTFSDTEAGIHLTTVAVNPATVEEPKSIDVVVHLGQFESNHPPTLALTASATVVPVNEPVTFTATAQDIDADLLAYSWSHFGDSNYRSISPNSPVLTRTFTVAGSYVVNCTVSDMKGGSATRNLLVTVGNGGGRFTINGRITLGGEGIAGVLVNANNANAVITDSDGRYIIPNLTAATYAMTPLLDGFTFTELFNNSVTIGPNFDGADFEASAVSRVSIVATVPACSEANVAAPAQVTIRRTGDASQPLTVSIATPSGTATRTDDYSITPAPGTGTQSFSTLTIPANEESLTVNIAPVNDGAAEGPETVTLELGPGNGYLIEDLARATVIIDDNDTTLPKVSLTIGEAKTTEGSATPASVTFTRSGFTSNSLFVTYQVSGSAKTNFDFIPLSGSLVIPAGSTSASLEVMTVNDLISESLETVTIRIASTGAFIADPAASNVTISIVDDDVQVLTVTATDPIATERDLSAPDSAADTATFLITRSGDTLEPLTIYYAVSGTNSGTIATALHGVDYETLPGVLTIPAGQTNGSVTIIPRQDGLGEGPESVMLQLGAGPTNYRLGNPNVASITINDAGDPPYVKVFGVDNVVEPSTAGRFRFSLKGSSIGSVTVHYTVSGTAANGVDFTGLPGTVNLVGNGVNSIDISVTAINDAIAEDLETITVTIIPDAAYQFFAPSSEATIWMRDDEQPTLFVDATSSSNPPSFTENGAGGSFYISRAGSTNLAITVNFIMSGSAANGVDYQSRSGIATIPAGAPGVDILITPINDSLAEGTETVTLELAPGAYGRGPAATFYLTDNETPSPALNFSASSIAANENAGLVDIPVVLSAASGTPVTVEYLVDSASRASISVNGTGVAPLPYWVQLRRVGNILSTFQSNNGSTWTQVSTNLDIAFGPELLAGLAISSQAEGSVATATFDNVTLSPGPLPPLQGRTVGFTAFQGTDSLTGGVYTVSGSGDGINGTQDDCYFVAAPVTGDFILTARITSVQSTAGSPQVGVMLRENTRRAARMVFVGGSPGVVPRMVWRPTTLTTAHGVGIDYTLAPGLLTFPPGTTSQNISIEITNDSMPEPDEPLTILLRNANGARLGPAAQFTFLIVDDDAAHVLPFVGFAASTSSGPETNSNPQVPVTLTIPATASVTVDYSISADTATAGEDFTVATGTLTFAAGDTVQSIPLILLDDTLIESSETVTLTLSNPAGLRLGTLTNHTFTILDDDTPVVTISSSDTNATETGDIALVTLIRTGSTNNDLIVNLTRAGTASSSSDYIGIDATVTMPAGENRITLSLVPTQDVIVEGTETAVMTVASGADYAAGVPSSITIFIADDDRNTVMIRADGPVAVEGGANGTLTITRSGNTDSPLTINLSLSGTAASGTDYTTTPSPITSLTFAAGQTTRTININPINDATTEGEEAVLVQISAGAYDIEGVAYASVTLQDNDVPPTVFISSPAAQGVVIAPTNGVWFEATAEDDGLPQSLTYAWTQVAGPGTVTFDGTNRPSAPAIFSAPGVYLVRVTVNDGQYSASDQITVNVGGTNSLVPGNWISSDIGPPTLRGFSGRSGSNWVLSVTGTGFAGTSDRAHAVTRPITGNGAIVARLLAVTGPTGAEAGLSVHDSLHRYARRAALVYQGSSRTLRFRPRVTNNTTDFVVTVANLALPIWLKLERVETTDTVSAFYATNNAGVPGPWIQVGANVVISMDATADYSFVGRSGSDTAAAMVTFDNVTLTPAAIGSAVLAEDFGDGIQAGTYSYNAGNDTHTLQGRGSLDSSGTFRGEQFTGDFILTALQVDATSSANNARSGIMVRDSMDNGAMAFVGRNPVGSFSSFVWRTNPKGSTAGLNGITQEQRWLRMIRRGNQITAQHAPNNSGTPGAWIQLGLPQTVFLQPTVIAGLYCDNAGGVGFNTATFTRLSVVPLHKTPIVDAGIAPTNITSPMALSGAVRDDGLPLAFTTEWAVAAAPGPVNFANSNSLATTVSFSDSGAYTLRLWADDGVARTFADLSFFLGTAFQKWQSTNFLGWGANTNAAPDADPDGDGLNNAGEYAFGGNPNLAGAHPIAVSLATEGTNQYLRITVPKNPAATDVSLRVETSPAITPPTWTTNGMVIEENTATLLRVRESIPISDAPWRFLRVLITFN